MTFNFTKDPVRGRRQERFHNSSPTIGELLGRHHFVIPAYQRNYAWTASHIETLLSDIVKMVELEFSDSEDAGYMHLLFQILLHQRPDNTFDIVDGQQRITTLLLILSTLAREAELFAKRNNDHPGALKEAAEIQALLKIDNTLTGEQSPRIVHSLSNESKAFGDIITPSVPISKIQGSKTMVAAIKTIQKFLREHAGVIKGTALKKGEPLPLNYLIAVKENAVNGLQVNLTMTDNANAASVAFRNANIGGKQLTNLELIRSTLAPSIDTPVFLPLWEELETVIDTSDKNATDNFLRAWLLAEYGVASTKAKVHAEYSHLTAMGTIQQNAETLRSMVSSARRLAAHEQGLSQNKPVDGLFWASINGYQQHRALLLAANHLEDTAPELFYLLCDEVGKTALSLSVLEARANTIEHHWVEWTRSIRSVHTAEDMDAFLNTTLRAFRRELEDTMAEDIIALSTNTKWSKDGKRPNANKTQFNALAYLAYHVEKAVGSKPGHAAAFYKNLTLEHIVPARPGFFPRPNYVTDEQFRDYVASLGNLTFLLGRENQNAGTKPMAEKVEVYATSNIALSRASTQALPITRGRSKSAKVLRIVPKIDAHFGLDHINDRSEQLADMIKDALMADASPV